MNESTNDSSQLTGEWRKGKKGMKEWTNEELKWNEMKWNEMKWNENDMKWNETEMKLFHQTTSMCKTADAYFALGIGTQPILGCWVRQRWQTQMKVVFGARWWVIEANKSSGSPSTLHLRMDVCNRCIWTQKIVSNMTETFSSNHVHVQDSRRLFCSWEWYATHLPHFQ